jgi:hypothetical protein
MGRQAGQRIAQRGARRGVPQQAPAQQAGAEPGHGGQGQHRDGGLRQARGARPCVLRHRDQAEPGAGQQQRDQSNQHRRGLAGKRGACGA